MIYPLPPSTTLNASVPPAPTIAVIFAPVPAPPAGPMFTVIVFAVTAVIYYVLVKIILGVSRLMANRLFKY